MDMSDLALVVLSLATLLVSCLTALLFLASNGSQPPLSRNILTHLKVAIVQAYNVFIGLRCLNLILQATSSSDQLPQLVTPILRLAGIFSLLALVGLLPANSLTLLLFVLQFGWLHGQNHEALVAKMIGGVAVIATVLSAGISVLLIWLEQIKQSHPKVKLVITSLLVTANVSILIFYAATAR